jgi:hypothetical protein
MDTQPDQSRIPHDDTAGSGQFQPQVITPSASVQPPAQPYTAPTPTPQVGGPAASLPELAPPEAIAPEDTNGSEDAAAYDDPAQDADADTVWQYAQQVVSGKDAAPLPQNVSWSAAEFIEHPKSTGWYGLLALAALALAALDYFVTRDVVSTSVIIIAAVMFGVYASHKPRTRKYALSPQGLQIEERVYTFQSFKAFSLTEEGSITSIVFSPLGRFATPITIYVTEDMEDRVLNYLVNFLPFEQHRADAVDGLLRRIRF